MHFTIHIYIYLLVKIFQKKALIDSGYAKAIYHTLELLSHQKEIRYVIPLYSCMASLLATIEHWDNTINLFEVTLSLQCWSFRNSCRTRLQLLISFVVDDARRRSFHFNRQYGIWAEYRIATCIHVEFTSTHYKYRLCQMVRSAHSRSRRILRTSHGFKNIEGNIGGMTHFKTQKHNIKINHGAFARWYHTFPFT